MGCFLTGATAAVSYSCNTPGWSTPCYRRSRTLLEEGRPGLQEEGQQLQLFIMDLTVNHLCEFLDDNNMFRIICFGPNRRIYISWQLQLKKRGERSLTL